MQTDCPCTRRVWAQSRVLTHRLKTSTTTPHYTHTLQYGACWPDAYCPQSAARVQVRLRLRQRLRLLQPTLRQARAHHGRVSGHRAGHCKDDCDSGWHGVWDGPTHWHAALEACSAAAGPAGCSQGGSELMWGADLATLVRIHPATLSRLEEPPGRLLIQNILLLTLALNHNMHS